MHRNPATLPPERFVVAALDEAIDRADDALRVLVANQQHGDQTQKADAAWTRSQLNAAKRARYYWENRLRPVCLADDCYLVPSSRPGAAPYRVTRAGGVWTCDATCQASAYHWHTAMAVALERAWELAEADEARTRVAAADLGDRRARFARALAEMNELYG